MTLPLSVAEVRHRTFHADSANPELAGMVDFFAERIVPYEVPMAPHQHHDRNRNSFSRMSTSLVSPRDALDLIVIAHAAPDCDTRMSLAGLLSGDSTLVFAVSDHGRVAPFVALRIAQSYAASGSYGRVAVLALDQAAVPYEDAGLATLSTDTDHAVALMLSSGGSVGMSSLVHIASVSDLSAALAVELATLAPDVVVAGRFVPELPGAVRAAADQLCTGVWSVLAGELAAPGPARRVVVADYEPALSYLCLAAFDVPGEPHVAA